MQTLDAPIFEVRQDSEWYKETKAYNERKAKLFKELNEKYMKDNGFVYWHSEYFGIDGNSADYETYKNELKKNPEKGRYYIFKKRSKYYPIFKAMLEELGRTNPFKPHDVLGTNNMTASQWVGDRWFYGVHDSSAVKGDEVVPVDYKEYLQLIMKLMEEKGME